VTTRTVLVSGADAATREAAISRLIQTADSAVPTAVILEGLASGSDAFDALAQRTDVSIARIAPGCLCCTGNLTLTVHLHRILRQRPALLYISLADSSHIERIENFLLQPIYGTWLTLADRLSYDAVG
jgi:G3E family GTPase